MCGRMAWIEGRVPRKRDGLTPNPCYSRRSVDVCFDWRFNVRKLLNVKGQAKVREEVRQRAACGNMGWCADCRKKRRRNPNARELPDFFCCDVHVVWSMYFIS
jgi:hypothetical protein